MESKTQPGKLLWLNGKIIFFDDILSKKPEDLGVSGSFELDTIRVIREWVSGRKSFEIRSSGSTGRIKKFRISREKLQSSANLTIQSLGLKEGMRAVLCLNPIYTAGFLFLIRSLIGKFNLYAVTPSALPLSDLPDQTLIDFISLVPNQLYEIIHKTDFNRWFGHESTILVGGAPVPAALQRQIEYLPGRIYHTFGMAETLSHIALKKLNGNDRTESFETLRSVTVKADERNCLIISAPHLSSRAIHTQDVIQIIDTRHFLWKGRLDSIINTGGYKIHIEELENEIEKIFNEVSIPNNFMIAPTPDPKLGERIVLLVEGKPAKPDEHLLSEILKAQLDKYHNPKQIFILEEFLYTESRKIDRIRTRALILNR